MCLVVYYLHSGDLPEAKCHGNSKDNVPFYPTWPSTKQKIKVECMSSGPKEAVSSISGDVGGVLLASAPELLPRNEKQVTNFKARATSSQDAAADHLFVVNATSL